MGLQIGFDPSGLPAKVVAALDDLIAAIQTWAGGVDGINAAERLNELTEGVASLPTVPTGMISPWPTSTAPTGYLLCDGAQVSRTTYVNLFTLLGTTYGSGDGSTTFNVPDLRGRFPLGKATSGTGSTLAGTGGSMDHSHAISGSTANESSHTHSIDFLSDDSNLTGVTVAAGAGVNEVQQSDHKHQVTGTSGSGSAHNHGAGTLTMDTDNPPFLAVNYVIKT
jgi:microcystin-dependent protein